MSYTSKPIQRAANLLKLPRADGMRYHPAITIRYGVNIYALAYSAFFILSDVLTNISIGTKFRISRADKAFLCADE